MEDKGFAIGLALVFLLVISGMTFLVGMPSNTTRVKAEFTHAGEHCVAVKHTEDKWWFGVHNRTTTIYCEDK